MIAYSIVPLADLAASGLPALVTNLRPAMIIIITATTPTRADSRFTISLIVVFRLPLGVVLQSPFAALLIPHWIAFFVVVSEVEDDEGVVVGDVELGAVPLVSVAAAIAVSGAQK
jgi:hypothetical protein